MQTAISSCCTTACMTMYHLLYCNYIGWRNQRTSMPYLAVSANNMQLPRNILKRLQEARDHCRMADQHVTCASTNIFNVNTNTVGNTVRECFLQMLTCVCTDTCSGLACGASLAQHSAQGAGVPRLWLRKCFLHSFRFTTYIVTRIAYLVFSGLQ